MSVLIDTSVWSDHFRKRNDVLAELMTLDQALTHPMIVAELACGTPPVQPRRGHRADHRQPAPGAEAVADHAGGCAWGDTDGNRAAGQELLPGAF